MSKETYNVLFLCTGNSARSIMAECILNRAGRGRFKAHSAGSHPVGRVNPHALALLERLDYPTGGLRSKSWEEFTGDRAPVLDFIFTVCDDAAGEACPIWPGRPITGHWGVPDPAAFEGSERECGRAFDDVYRMLENRIGIFVNLPLDAIDPPTLQRRLRAIGQAVPVRDAV